MIYIGDIVMKQEERVLFHVAAILYNSQSDNIKRDNILKKIVESIIAVNGNKLLTCTEVSVKIKNSIHMIVVEDEIEGIICNKKNRQFEIDYSSLQLKVRLKKDRYEHIMNKNDRNLESYVKEFIQTRGYTNDEKELIEKFIYEFYCRNVKEMSELIGGEFESHLQAYKEELEPEQSVIIQEFIDWDNEDKNLMLTAVANYALEYLLISGNSDLQNRKNIKSAFSGKKLYIDTNVLFYCLGINGKTYEEANRIFLKKCRDCQEQIIISYYTDTEFKKTIEHFGHELERVNSPLIHNTTVSAQLGNKDVYAYYVSWAKTRKSLDDPKYFKQYLIDKYEDLIQEYGIIVERSIPFPEEELQENSVLRKYEEEIMCQAAVNYDARNIFLVESRRAAGAKNLQTADTIFISADKVLQQWDAAREKDAPVVVAPNLWLLFLARIISRSEDDCKCFISYINLVNSETIITNKEFFTVVKTIFSMMDDVEQQESIIEVMVNEEFAFLNNGNEKRSMEFIIDKTQMEAQRILEKTVEELKECVSKKNAQLEKVQETARDQQLALIENEQINEKESHNQYESYIKLQHEKQKLEERNSELAHKSNRYRIIIGAMVIAIITIPVICELIDIFIVKNPNPLTLKIFNYIMKGSACEPEDIKELYRDFIIRGIAVVTAVIDGIIAKFIITKKDG